MTFDLVVAISMHFYERCHTKRDVCNFRFVRRREILHLRAVCQFVTRGGGGGGVYSDIFIIRTLVHLLLLFFFWGGGGQNFSLQYFWGVF